MHCGKRGRNARFHVRARHLEVSTASAAASSSLVSCFRLPREEAFVRGPSDTGVAGTGASASEVCCPAGEKNAANAASSSSSCCNCPSSTLMSSRASRESGEVGAASISISPPSCASESCEELTSGSSRITGSAEVSEWRSASSLSRAVLPSLACCKRLRSFRVSTKPACVVRSNVRSGPAL